MKWKVADWIVRIVLALGFALASTGKLMSHPGVLEMFDQFGLPDGFHWVIGGLELLGAILILIPKTRLLAIAVLGSVVLGAAVMHLLHDPAIQLLRPLVFAVLLGLAAYLGRRLSG